MRLYLSNPLPSFFCQCSFDYEDCGYRSSPLVKVGLFKGLYVDPATKSIDLYAVRHLAEWNTRRRTCHHCPQRQGAASWEESLWHTEREDQKVCTVWEFSMWWKAHWNVMFMGGRTCDDMGEILKGLVAQPGFHRERGEESSFEWSVYGRHAFFVPR